MKYPVYLLITLCLTAGVLSCTKKNPDEFTVVSFPDFFNFDVPEPWPRWDSAVNYFLNEVKKENPEFVLIAGDLVNGHWWDGRKCIEQMSALYYGGWKRRMKKHDLMYYVAIGDHELGDDPWPANKAMLVPHFERAFKENLQMPLNGPDNKKGLSYYVRHKNALFITVETFELTDTLLEPTIGEKQLQWFQDVLNENKDAGFIIVQGHIPIIGKPVARSSSMLMLKDSTQNPFWKTMVEANVDVYLCGEFHAVTIDEKDGIWQVVHGSSWGRKIVNTQDYLIIDVKPGEMILTMKSFEMEANGDNMWNLNKANGPREVVTIPTHVLKNGPKITGSVTIDKYEGTKKYKNLHGVFSN